MNIYQSSTTFSVKRFFGCVLAFILMGLCQNAVSASAMMQKDPGKTSKENVSPAPQKKRASSAATASEENHGIGEDYNPESPGNPGDGNTVTPEKTYRLTVVTNPSGAGSAYANSYNLRQGEQTSVYTYNNSGFDFLNWTIEGEEVSTSTSFYYVMPEYDVTIVANYSYNPASPGNPSPEEQKVKHPVTVRAIPSGSASVSPSGPFDMEENASRQIYAYPNSGWELTGWAINGEPLQDTSSPINITMGEKALDIVAYLTYNPSSPANPAANYYNPTTGEVIVDDFTPGDLYYALSNLVGYDNFSNVSSLIVKGEMTSNDLGNLSYFSNAETIDLSRTGGVSDIPWYAFEYMGASSIMLPSTITSIGSYAFYECNNLSSLTIYAQEPPECFPDTFYGFTNKDNYTIYVPASAIELYSNADYWKDFSILPITNDAHMLQVNLPADASDGRYKNYYIELVNLSSGVKQKYVISDRMLYTFNNLKKDEKYDIYMYSQSGLEIGKIENVIIPNEDIEVTFDNLKSLHTVFASVIDGDGNDVTSQVSVEWLRPHADGNVTYLRKAASVSEIPDDQLLICRVSLDNKLGTVYVNPEDVEFTVDNNNNICVVNLVPFRTIGLSGLVIDGDGAPLSGASVSVNQTLNGKHSKTYTTKTDRKGQWNVTVLDAPETHLTYAASECVNVNDTISAFEAGINTLDLGKTTLKSIVGARVTYGFTYHAAGVEDVESYYPDYQNVAVTVFNVTQDRPHNEVSLQYPILEVLDENINVGDELQLTATSKTGTFNPIVETVTVGENQRAEVTFDIVGKGGIAASFEMTDNPAVVAMLYSAKGELVKKQTYKEAKTKFTELEDGDYTLVTMGQSDLMNSILRLTNFEEIGLVEGKDYVKNSVKVESGALSEIKNPEIPAFDESLFYYTNSTTSFSSNKSSITTGNYLTLRSAIDFKGVYKNDISNVALIVDLPEACDFVEQSVIQGPTLLPYTFDNHRLTVQLGNNYQSQTRFCVIPTTGGSFNATASIVFDYNGKTLTQPIGCTSCTIQDLFISVPSIVAKTNVSISGNAIGQSAIEIYDDGTLIGKTTSLANGTWETTCELNEPYNLSTHSIYAKVTTKAGLELISETKQVKYDVNMIVPEKVTMLYYNPEFVGQYNIVFDLINRTVTPKSYYFFPYKSYPNWMGSGTEPKDFTFIADLSNNDSTAVNGVTIRVYTDNGYWRNLEAQYDTSMNRWIAASKFTEEEAPIGVKVNVNSVCNVEVDAEMMDQSLTYANEIIDDIKETQTEIGEISSALSKILNQDDFDVKELERIMDVLGVDYSYNGGTDIDEIKINNDITQCDLLLNDSSITSLEKIVSSDLYSEELSEYLNGVTYTTCEGLNVEDLISDGYIEITKTNGCKIYILATNETYAIVDFSTNTHFIFAENSSLMKVIRRAPQDDFVNNLLSTIEWLGKGCDKISGYAKAILDMVDSIIDTLNATNTKLTKQIGSLCDDAIYLNQRGGNSFLIGLIDVKLQAALSAKAANKKIIELLSDIKDKLGFTKKIGKGFSILSIVSTIQSGISDLRTLHKLYDRCLPCKDDEENAKNIQSSLRGLGLGAIAFYTLQLTSDIASLVGAETGIFAALPTGGSSLSAVVISISLVAANYFACQCYERTFENNINIQEVRIKGLKCNKEDDDDDDDDDDDGDDNDDDDDDDPPYPTTDPIHDPSGFVYEAVPENCVEGVQATIYYKETKEDMYGDPYEDIVLWDAEEYAQENPLFTDENGMYRWDVPQGLWQVKFEKDGYVTAYSEWLPVPPPQLEVNIGIVQNKQPEVTEARAYEEGVEVQFDKFMDLSTLSTDNIYVTANGEKLNGKIRFIDSELADEYASEDDADATRYASRIRFVPEEKLSATTGEIRVTVSRNVLSYAGIPMTETFSQVLDVEKEVQVIAAEDVKVLYGGEKEVTIFALPYEAAAGRKLHISTSSDLITSIDKTEAVIDEEGKATVMVKGDLPGQAQLSFSIDDVTVTGECAVDVVTEIIVAEAPKASRASGTAVYRGSKVQLTTDSKDGVIYFTTDGSCPCDENGTRRKYTVPIVINEDTKILAMTSVGNGDDDVSETVEFNYTLKRGDMDFIMDEGWTWISHNFDIPIAVETLASDENVHSIMSQTQEVIRDPELGLTGLLKELVASESYKVEAKGVTARQRVTDYSWNPSNPIALKSGWNWLGYPVAQTMSIDEAFAPTDVETLDVIVGQNGFAQYDGEKWVGTLETMSPGLGYMYQSQTAKKVVYNSSIVSKAAAHSATGIADRTPLVVDVHKYPSVMPIIATVISEDGALLDNEDYQVYAFSGTECRGIGKLVNGLVMMNVYGDSGDAISFQVTNVDGDMTFATDSSLSFLEDLIGNLNDPYEISINSVTGIKGISYDGKIKVNVVGDMLVIKGIAANDIEVVEVYDTDGIKLIHETNVSESGIRISHLTTGVYVVIVNGNGEYSYHKISLR